MLLSPYSNPFTRRSLALNSCWVLRCVTRGYTPVSDVLAVDTHLYRVSGGHTPVADPQQQPPLLTWNGLVVGQIEHDDKHARPGNDESQDQDPGQRGAEGGVEVVGERLLRPSRGRRHRLAALAVDDHGGGCWPSWGEEKRWSDAASSPHPVMETSKVKSSSIFSMTLF